METNRKWKKYFHFNIIFLMLGRILKAFLNSLKQLLTWWNLSAGFLVFISIVVAIVLAFQKSKAEFNGMVQSIMQVNSYNRGVQNTFKGVISDEEYKKVADNSGYFMLSFHNFSTDVYRQNWKVIASMPNGCKLNYLQFIGEMEGANLINDQIIALYIQFDPNKADIYSVPKKFLYTQLKDSVSRIDDEINTLAPCQPAFLADLF